MSRDLILGTAGHIDHGKTSLVKALTGIDCDRLPEERQRGITIDIGFAHLELDDCRLAIVDVPGHERFIKNMLAGATGIDLALLVIAADDSIMPQTREHLEILKLLGVSRGVIAITKADLVDATTLQVVELEVRELVKDSFLADAAIVATSTATGQGLVELKSELARATAAVAMRQDHGRFRVAIDRAFVVQGHGTVVTGSILSGAVEVEDEVDWHRNGVAERVRVRSLTVHGQPVRRVIRGQRAGINLAGVSREEVQRGQELASPGYLIASRVLTVRLMASGGLGLPIRHRLPVRLHVGTAEVMANVSLLDRNQIDPGLAGLAQLFLAEPVTTVWGQPFVLRDSSAESTLGGGRVLQTNAVKIRRRDLESQEQLERLESSDPATRIQAVAWFGGFGGIDIAEVVRSAGVPEPEASVLLGRLLANGDLLELSVGHQRRTLLHAGRIKEMENQILQVLSTLHLENPLITQHDRQKALSRLGYLGNEPLLQAITDRLIALKKLVGDSRRIARADFKPKLSHNQQKLKQRIVEAFMSGGFQPPEPKEFVNHAAGNASALSEIFEVAVAEGYLVKIREDLYFSVDAESEMRKRVTERLVGGTGLSVAEVRDLLGTTRKYAVPICEYLDRAGVTRREGDLRVLARPEPSSSLPFEEVRSQN